MITAKEMREAQKKNGPAFIESIRDYILHEISEELDRIANDRRLCDQATADVSIDMRDEHGEKILTEFVDEAIPLVREVLHQAGYKASFVESFCGPYCTHTLKIEVSWDE